MQDVFVTWRMMPLFSALTLSQTELSDELVEPLASWLAWPAAAPGGRTE